MKLRYWGVLLDFGGLSWKVEGTVVEHLKGSFEWRRDRENKGRSEVCKYKESQIPEIEVRTIIILSLFTLFHLYIFLSEFLDSQFEHQKMKTSRHRT